jgi:O-antigen/teichoic acid export membrane protein
MTGESAGGRREAEEATRGSAIKLGAEVVSRLLGFATMWLLLRGLGPLRGLGASEFGVLGELSVYALLLAEAGELGLQALASRALVAGTLSLESLVRARSALALLVAGLAVAGGLALDGPALALLVAWFALSGWCEFFGVALRCRGARLAEAGVLLVLRGGALLAAVLALAAGARLTGVAAALALSPLPALVLGAWRLRRSAPSPAVGGGLVSPVAVLEQSFPLAVHGLLLLLSPRVEFLVLSWLLPDRQAVGLFYAALLVFWPLAMIPTAIAAGAMPALTREALQGGAAVRRRTAALLALVAAPAAIGLVLVARPAAELLLGPGSSPADHAATAELLRLLCLALPALFANALLSASLIAAGRAPWLPRLTASRVLIALALALALVPALGARGAALGLALAEWLLVALASTACRRASFAVPVLRPLGWALVSCVPMALAVRGVSGSLALAVPVGAITWAASLAAAWKLLPGVVERLAEAER